MKTKKSPMIRLLDNIGLGIIDSNNLLAKLWQVTLKRLGIKSHQWESLLHQWTSRNVPIIGKSSTIITRNNLTGRLAEPSITWKVFTQGLEILNASRMYKCIRFEVHFVAAKGDETEIISIDVYDRGNDVDNKLLSTAAKELLTVPLVPGTLTVPGVIYKLEGFDNKHFNGAIMERKGNENKVICRTEFNGCSVIGIMLFKADGIDSDDWIMHSTLSSLTSLSGGD